MAIKVGDVKDAGGQTTEQNFVLADSPVFFARNAAHFLSFLKLKGIQAGETLKFTPWHTLPQHEPLGSINEARRIAYQDSARTRHANARLVRRFYQCFASGDFLGMQQCLHKDVEFHDLEFDLIGKPLVGAMWQMLCMKPDGIRVQVRHVEADADEGTAEWECHYGFQKGSDSEVRPIHNKVEATFAFQNGLIHQHTDSCDFWTWFEQAMEPRGTAAKLIDAVEDKLAPVVHVEDKARGAVKAEAGQKLDGFIPLLQGQKPADSN